MPGHGGARSLPLTPFVPEMAQVLGHGPIPPMFSIGTPDPPILLRFASLLRLLPESRIPTIVPPVVPLFPQPGRMLIKIPLLSAPSPIPVLHIASPPLPRSAAPSFFHHSISQPGSLPHSLQPPSPQAFILSSPIPMQLCPPIPFRTRVAPNTAVLHTSPFLHNSPCPILLQPPKYPRCHSNPQHCRLPLSSPKLQVGPGWRSRPWGLTVGPRVQRAFGGRWICLGVHGGGAAGN